MVLRPSSCPRFLSAPRRRVYPHVGFSCATRTMSSRMSFAVGGRPGLRFLLPSYLAAMRQRYQRRSVAGVATDAIWASASRPKAWGLDREPAPVVVREPETLAPKPGSEHTVLLLQVVDHILLLAVDPASQPERAVGIARGRSSWS